MATSPIFKPLTADQRKGLIEKFKSREVPANEKLLEEGELGEVHRFESRFERWRPELSGTAWREVSPRSAGGGLLLDLGTHLIDQALQLFGPAAEVYGEVDHSRGGPADDDVFVAIRHESGTRSHLWASSVAADLGPRMRVLGSRGAFVVDALDSQEQELRSGRTPGEGWGAEPEEHWGRLVRGEEERPVQAAAGAWPEFYRRVEAALRGAGEMPVDPADAVAVLDVIERAAGED
jgi:predicted dehydrogenase